MGREGVRLDYLNLFTILRAIHSRTSRGRWTPRADLASEIISNEFYDKTKTRLN